MATPTSSTATVREVHTFNNGEWLKKTITANTIGELRVEFGIPDNVIVKVTTDSIDKEFVANNEVLPEAGDGEKMYIAWQANNKTGGK